MVVGNGGVSDVLSCDMGLNESRKELSGVEQIEVEVRLHWRGGYIYYTTTTTNNSDTK